MWFLFPLLHLDWYTSVSDWTLIKYYLSFYPVVTFQVSSHPMVFRITSLICYLIFPTFFQRNFYLSCLQILFPLQSLSPLLCTVSYKLVMSISFCYLSTFFSRSYFYLSSSYFFSLFDLSYLFKHSWFLHFSKFYLLFNLSLSLILPVFNVFI